MPPPPAPASPATSSPPITTPILPGDPPLWIFIFAFTVFGDLPPDDVTIYLDYYKRATDRHGSVIFRSKPILSMTEDEMNARVVVEANNWRKTVLRQLFMTDSSPF